MLALLLSALVGMGSARPIYAQADDARYTFALVGVSLAEALDRLIDETQLSLVYESDLVFGKTTFCKAERVTAETLLRCVLHETGLDFIRLSSGTYVLITDPETAPRYGSLAGRVVDADTGTPLADASVMLAGENTGTATNRYGRFAFAALRPGTHRLVITHVAYHGRADSVWVAPDAHDRVEIGLTPRIVLSAPVVVSGFEIRLPSESLGRGSPPSNDRLYPAGVGMPDVVQTLDAVVGVRLGDALSDVHVQGGDANEQRFLLDGAPVLIPVSNGGFIGPFSPFATGQVTVQKAGFGAAHGSGLSGVIEVEHLLGEGPSLTAQVDPLSTNLRWTGKAGSPALQEAAWMVAARHGLWDVYEPARLETLFRNWGAPDRFLLQALQEQPGPTLAEDAATGSLEVGFSDIHAAARVRFGGLRSLNASFYRGESRFGIESTIPAISGAMKEVEDVYRWTNRTGHLSYEWVSGRRLFASVSAWTSSYSLFHPARVSSEDFNQINELGVRLQGDLAATTKHQMSGALAVTNTESDFSLSLDPFGTEPTGPSTIDPAMWRIEGFVEDRVALGHRTTFTVGSRLTYLPSQKTVYAEPRLAFQYDRELGSYGSGALRMAGGLYRQYLHSFDVANYNVTSLLPRVRFWMPVGRHQRLPEAYHVTVAALYKPAPVWEFGIETYYKHQPHVLVLDYGSQPADPAAVFTNAEGYAYGLALTARRTTQRLQFTGHYEYAVARRRIANRFGGAFVPVPWDAPHRLYLALDVVALPSVTATVRWQGVYGRSWGFRQAYYDYLEPGTLAHAFSPFDLSDPAAHRLPVFSQWDVGLAYAREVAGVGLQARLAVINLLDRDNVNDWSLRYEETTGSYVRQPRYAAPFIPSLSLRVSL